MHICIDIDACISARDPCQNYILVRSQWCVRDTLFRFVSPRVFYLFVCLSLAHIDTVSRSLAHSLFLSPSLSLSSLFPLSCSLSLSCCVCVCVSLPFPSNSLSLSLLLFLSPSLSLSLSFLDLSYSRSFSLSLPLSCAHSLSLSLSLFFFIFCSLPLSVCLHPFLPMFVFSYWLALWSDPCIESFCLRRNNFK